MKLEEAKEYLKEIQNNCTRGMMKGAIYTDDKAEEKAIAIETVLQELEQEQENNLLLRIREKNWNKNSIPKKKIEDMKNKKHEEYINILSEYGNIDTDITFDIPNKNVRKHLDELMLEIIILQELLEDK